MLKIKPSALRIFEDYGPAIGKCRRELISQGWFGGDWWLNVVFDANGFTFQLSKTSWFNHNGSGIHIEFWLEEQEIQSKEVSVVLHFEADTPSRKELGERFREAFSAIEHDFEDYRVNHRAICDKLQKQVPFSKSSLPRVVVAEFSRLQAIAPTIDSLLD